MSQLGDWKKQRVALVLQKDMSYFKKMTTPSTIGSKSVIMGSNTWKSLPGRNGLIGRDNIVISQSDKTRALIYGEAVHDNCNVNVCK